MLCFTRRPFGVSAALTVSLSGHAFLIPAQLLSPGISLLLNLATELRESPCQLRCFPGHCMACSSM